VMASTYLLVALLLVVGWLKRANVLYAVEYVVNTLQGQAKRRKANRHACAQRFAALRAIHILC